MQTFGSNTYTLRIGRYILLLNCIEFSDLLPTCFKTKISVSMKMDFDHCNILISIKYNMYHIKLARMVES